MAHYAKVVDGIVDQIIVAEADFFDTFVDSSPGTWIETSDQIRKNYAGMGYSYDVSRDAFLSPQPFPSWTLDEGTCQWIPPIPYPDDGRKYQWDEVTQWDVVS